MAKYSYASCVSVRTSGRTQASARLLPECVFRCVGSGSMCVRVRGEVSLGWPWLESWRRAEVKEEICRKDTHHFPHYYFFFFYVSVSHCFFFFLSLSYTSSASFLFPHLHSFCSGSSRLSLPFKTLYDPSSNAKSDFYRSYLKFV